MGSHSLEMFSTSEREYLKIVVRETYYKMELNARFRPSYRRKLESRIRSKARLIHADWDLYVAARRRAEHLDYRRRTRRGRAPPGRSR